MKCIQYFDIISCMVGGFSPDQVKEKKQRKSANSDPPGQQPLKHLYW